jgi:hypothetical protein
MNEGWKCPVCGGGVAPTEKTCPCVTVKAAPYPVYPYYPMYPLCPPIAPYYKVTYAGNSGIIKS